MNPTEPSVLSVAVTRRSAIRTIAGAGAALLAVSAIAPLAAQHTSRLYTVSANANFRTGPGTGHPVITVIGKGATFVLAGQTQNGYAAIVYQNRNGWVLASLVMDAGPIQPDPDPVISGSRKATASVNLRSGPSTSNSVLRVLKAGSIVRSSDTVRSGFRYVIHDGLAGWIADAYLVRVTNSGPVPNVLVTTARLNLRAQPNTTAAVKLVLPKGAQVVPTSNLQNGFAEVRYQGVTGWASFDYLTTP